MSFYSNLDDEGKKLYDDYIKAKEAWFAYCRPKVFANFNDYLNKTNRNFNRYEYYTSKYTNIDIKTRSEITDDNKKLYKLLSIKFHPDKFNKQNADNFFAMINKAQNDNNDIFLQHILELSEEILNYTNDEFNKFYESLTKDDEKSESQNISLEDSVQYKFYIGKTKNTDINFSYFTEEELIKEIETHYDVDFVKFYLNRYKDNENIKKACYIRMETENKKLLEENKILKDILEKINKSSDKL